MPTAANAHRISVNAMLQIYFFHAFLSMFDVTARPLLRDAAVESLTSCWGRDRTTFYDGTVRTARTLSSTAVHNNCA